MIALLLATALSVMPNSQGEFVPFKFSGNMPFMLELFDEHRLPKEGECLIQKVYRVDPGYHEIWANWLIVPCPTEEHKK